MEKFATLINGNKPVLVDFFATWCGPCQLMPPILDQVKSSVGDQATIIKIDVDRNPAVATKYGVRGVPTLILFKDGEIKWQQSGVVQARELTQVITSNL